ncbi:hypothetical protein B0T22DRAFT_35389 [Podospora appendiculata]|uniref:Cell wall mannoprotein PIR1-like C-terminal domain-containing protein n=1 Tax=Podospora appendiculata TaxID=314037 RepID=A0AAE0XHS7_9PEZI|nr:hypothetical protein B0T22DRAFT_35389 [Podospora appendiculata]
MKYQALALLSAAVGLVAAQGVTDKIAPTASVPSDWQPSIDGTFEIAIVHPAAPQKRGLAPQKRAECSGNGILVAKLQDGVVTDAQGRTGYIASNYQFQFDEPPQAGAIYTAGFSHLPNGSLALGDSTVFYQCQSGNFYNLYDRYWAAQCSPAHIQVIPCGGKAAEATFNSQAVATAYVTTTVVVPLSDGQPQVVTTVTPVLLCQIGDGQVQGHTTPCASMTAASVKTESSVTPVSQFSDGQIQVTPVSQYSDGQIQVTPVTTAVPPTATTTATESVPAPSSTGAVPKGTESLTTAVHPTQTVAPSATSAPAASGAGRGVEVAGSVGALVVGVVAAVWFL